LDNYSVCEREIKVLMSVTILVVGYHDLMRQAVRGWLERTFAGCHVVEATDAKEAIPIIEASSPDVVVIDAGLSSGNGLETAARLKVIDPAVPIVVLSSYGDDQRARALSSGVSACVPIQRLTELEYTLVRLLSPEASRSKTSTRSMMEESGR
jgi:CheY-like chemotaxis protein